MIFEWLGRVIGLALILVVGGAICWCFTKFGKLIRGDKTPVTWAEIEGEKTTQNTPDGKTPETWAEIERKDRIKKRWFTLFVVYGIIVAALFIISCFV